MNLCVTPIIRAAISDRRAYPTSFTVNRKFWVNGAAKNRSPSELLNVRGFQCCVGFYMKEAGFSRDGLRGRGHASCLSPRATPNAPRTASRLHMLFANNDIYLLNDDAGSSWEQIEMNLIRAFAGIGVSVKFFGEIPKAA